MVLDPGWLRSDPPPLKLRLRHLCVSQVFELELASCSRMVSSCCTAALHPQRPHEEFCKEFCSYGGRSSIIPTPPHLLRPKSCDSYSSEDEFNNVYTFDCTTSSRQRTKGEVRILIALPSSEGCERLTVVWCRVESGHVQTCKS